MQRDRPGTVMPVGAQAKSLISIDTRGYGVRFIAVVFGGPRLTSRPRMP